MTLERRIGQWAFAFLFIIFFYACKEDKNTPDISNIPVNIKVERFEKDLFEADTTKPADFYQKIHQKHPDFLNAFIYNVLRYEGKDSSDLALGKYLSGFVNYPSVKKLYDTCMVVYPNLTDIDKQFTNAFRYAKYYFPNKPTPQLYSLISELSVGSFTVNDSIMGFGLDYGLGSSYSGYKSVFPNYIIKNLDKEHLIKRTVEAYINDNLKATPVSGNRLLDLIIDNGKTLYVMDCLLPDMPDSIKMEYGTKQMDWCEKNEGNIWTHFINENLLYSDKIADIRKLIEISPVGPSGMPQEAPGRTGNWIGWQIIKNYMKRNKNVSIEDLLKIQDAQKILDESKYKPKI